MRRSLIGRYYLWPIIESGLILGIILTGIYVRTNHLGEFPLGYTWDEVAITYDAWGIADDGYDHHGKYLPLSFESLGDQKAPGIIYLMALVIKIFEVNPLSIRVVSAIVGVCLLGLIPLLSTLLVDKHRYLMALTSASVTAFSPLLIHISRVGYETRSVERSAMKTEWVWQCN